MSAIWVCSQSRSAVVGHERRAGAGGPGFGAPQHLLDHGMAALGDLQHAALVDLGPAVVPLAREHGPAGEDVELGEGVGCLRQRRRLGQDRGDQRLEELLLARQGVLLGVEDLLLLLAESLGHVPLAADRRLPADVIGRHKVEVGLRHLDVVAEVVREPHLEAADTGALLLGALEVGQPGLVVRASGRAAGRAPRRSPPG